MLRKEEIASDLSPTKPLDICIIDYELGFRTKPSPVQQEQPVNRDWVCQGFKLVDGQVEKCDWSATGQRALVGGLYREHVRNSKHVFSDGTTSIEPPCRMYLLPP